jgi:hypothetical protein
MTSPALPPTPPRPPSSTSASLPHPRDAHAGRARSDGHATFHKTLATARAAHALPLQQARDRPAATKLPPQHPPPAAAASPRARESATRELEPTLDPLERHAAQLAPPGFAVAPPPVIATEAAPAALRAASLETLLPALVRRIAWSAEGRERGTVRMEIGAGELQGAVLLVQADAGEVKIHLSVPGGADRDAWREKLSRRLDARGVRVVSIEVD